MLSVLSNCLSIWNENIFDYYEIETIVFIRNLGLLNEIGMIFKKGID